MSSYEEAAAWIAGYDPSAAPKPPPGVSTVPWVGSVAGVLHSLRTGKDLSPHALRAELTRGLTSADAISATVSALLAGPSRPALWSLSAVLLSSTEPEELDVEDAVRAAAIALCSRALDRLQGAQAVPVAVRLARIAEQAGDDKLAAETWATAMHHEPLVAWALAESEWKLPGQADPEAAAIEAASGDDLTLRQAIRDLRQGDRTAADSLDPLVDTLWQARLVRAVEHLRDAATGAQDAGTSASLALELVESIEGRPGVALVQTLAEILRGERDEAAEFLGRAHPGIGRPGLEAMLDALTEAIRTPPKDPTVVLRRACFEALLDPLAAMLEPRSPMAVLRKMMFGATLLTVLMGAGTAMAQTPDVGSTHDETIQVDDDTGDLDDGDLDDDESEVDLEPDPDDDGDDDLDDPGDDETEDDDADDGDADEGDADDADEGDADEGDADEGDAEENAGDEGDADPTDEGDQDPEDLDEEGKDRPGWGGKTRGW